MEEKNEFKRSTTPEPSFLEKEVSEIKSLLEQNLKVSQEILGLTQKMKHWVSWQRFWGLVKILIIIIPLVLGLWYLPSIIEKWVTPYQNILQSLQAQPTGYQDALKQVK